eukprot:m.486996 g.486996  ORF g.486996 m.486996 type:complete len:618 (+) comp21748_c0_seq2:393-2246(+)
MAVLKSPRALDQQLCVDKLINHTQLDLGILDIDSDCLKTVVLASLGAATDAEASLVSIVEKEGGFLLQFKSEHKRDEALSKMRAYGQLPHARAADTVAPARLVPHALSIDCVEWVQHASCERNKDCPFRHPPPVARVPCRHWIRSKGECWYGQHCNFLHPGSAISGDKNAGADGKPSPEDGVARNSIKSRKAAEDSTVDDVLSVNFANTALNASPRKTPTDMFPAPRSESDTSDTIAYRSNAKSPVPDSDSSSNDSNCGDVFGSGMSLDDLPPTATEQQQSPGQWGTPPLQYPPPHHHFSSQPWPIRPAPAGSRGHATGSFPGPPGLHGALNGLHHAHNTPRRMDAHEGHPPVSSSPMSAGSPWGASHHVFVSSSAIPAAASPQSQRRQTTMSSSAVVGSPSLRHAPRHPHAFSTDPHDAIMSSSAPTPFPPDVGHNTGRDAGRRHLHEHSGWSRGHAHNGTGQFGSTCSDGSTLSASFSSADDEVIFGHAENHGRTDYAKDDGNADASDPDVIGRVSSQRRLPFAPSQRAPPDDDDLQWPLSTDQPSDDRSRSRPSGRCSECVYLAEQMVAMQAKLKAVTSLNAQLAQQALHKDEELAQLRAGLTSATTTSKMKHG